MAGATSVEQMWTTFNSITGTNILFHGINFPGKQFSTFLHSPIHTIRLDRGWDSLLLVLKFLNTKWHKIYKHLLFGSMLNSWLCQYD